MRAGAQRVTLRHQRLCSAGPRGAATGGFDMAYPDFKKRADEVRQWSRDLRKTMAALDKTIEKNETGWSDLSDKVKSARDVHNKSLEICGKRSREAYDLFLEMEDLRKEFVEVEKTDKAKAKELKKKIDDKQKQVDGVVDRINPLLKDAKALSDSLKDLGSSLKTLKSSIKI
ncbi:MAG: hypothetical protein AAGC57_03845 [Pseudomonadota bacterium]